MIQDPFTGADITAKAESLTARLREANRKYHAQKAPDCTTWEQYSIPALRGGRMAGEGCERHGIFLSTAS